MWVFAVLQWPLSVVLSWRQFPHGGCADGPTVWVNPMSVLIRDLNNHLITQGKQGVLLKTMHYNYIKSTNLQVAEIIFGPVCVRECLIEISAV